MDRITAGEDIFPAGSPLPRTIVTDMEKFRLRARARFESCVIIFRYVGIMVWFRFRFR